MRKLFSISLALFLMIGCLSGLVPAAFAEGEESGIIGITKNPRGEIVTEGEDKFFVSHAYGYVGLIWELVSPDGETVFRGEEALRAFPGLDMAGYEGEELQLITIPYSLNGWSVRTRFIDENNDWALSEAAEITVIRGDVPAPEVKPPETGAKLKLGEKTTLSVEASSPGGDTLKYQWYRSYSAARNSGEPITGATQASFTPPEEVGLFFYYVGVWCVNGRMTSAPVYTPAVAVIYTEPEATPEPSPEPAPETEPSGTPAPEPEAAETAAPAPEPSPQAAEESRLPGGRGTLLIALGAMAVLAIFAVSVTFLIMRAVARRRGDEEEPEEKPKENTGKRS